MQYDLNRFVKAQSRVYSNVVEELRAGRKESHGMWFVFPQLRGLGYSSMAVRYAIEDLIEAQSYLAHPVLGSRLLECSEALLLHRATPIRLILGTPDDLKLHSSMTLFGAASSGNEAARAVFSSICESFFGNQQDPRTLCLLEEPNSAN